MENYDAVIIGAGAAGLMCAITAGQRGRKSLIIDHNKKIGEKIRISGGGRCNFTNIHTSPDNFISKNSHFCKSALNAYSPQDFIGLLISYNISYYEKTLGQLFCDETANDIILMLSAECHKANIDIMLECNIDDMIKINDGYQITSDHGNFAAKSMVIATGGKSIPKMGATGFAYDIAKQFGHDIIEPMPALVPLTYGSDDLELLQNLSGISLDISVKCGNMSFKEALLFTHKGLSGPAILQISSYWQLGMAINLNLAPTIDIYQFLKIAKDSRSKQAVHNILSDILPKKLAQMMVKNNGITNKIGEVSNKSLKKLGDNINYWQIIPSGSEGFRIAEVTKGGIDTDQIYSKTMESKLSPNLYFIGECLDVTGHLGGYNFQWAWSSGYVAGNVV